MAHLQGGSIGSALLPAKFHVISCHDVVGDWAVTGEGAAQPDAPGDDSDAVELEGMRRYRLVEFRAGGQPFVEPFLAPDDDVALLRALSAAEGPLAELWRGDELIRRWWVGGGRGPANPS
jgi:hypothetical protein